MKATEATNQNFTGAGGRVVAVSDATCARTQGRDLRTAAFALAISRVARATALRGV